ncbi:MAG: ABC transporter ATP-binding protein [Myxococcales bacterium]|nr:ABC transporter ATP-binding protein [Myxococcales bacterium]HIK83827.1 ABC transporter ATP-binding protein [Myxococcales bacterium]
MIIEAIDVTKVYETRGVETRALDDVSLALGKGEFTALAGPSGSGKTTLLNLLGALDTPTSGKIQLDGVELSDLSASALSALRLRKLGFVFQAYNLIPVLSARENVEFVMELQGISLKERRKRADEVLERVELGGLGDKRPLEMSGGQQQRVAVARAIASRPSIVLADEPTANLDSGTAQRLLDLMLQLNREDGVTFLFSTHDPLVMDSARRLVRLRDGKIIGDETKAPSST